MEIDRAHTTLTTEIEALAKRTHAPPPASDVRTELRHKEIREALARMSATERSKALGEALNDNDSDVLTAVLNGSRITSGMTKTELDAFRYRWKHTVHAGEMKRLEALEKARDALQLGGKILLDASVKAYDARVVTSAQRSDQLARAALASSGG